MTCSQIALLSTLLTGRLAAAFSRRSLEFLAEDEEPREDEEMEGEEPEDVNPRNIKIPAAKTKAAAYAGLMAAAARARQLAGALHTCSNCAICFRVKRCVVAGGARLTGMGRGAAAPRVCAAACDTAAAEWHLIFLQVPI